MNKKYNKKELLEWLSLIFGKGFDTNVLTEDITENMENSEVAYAQIVAIIKNQPTITNKDIKNWAGNIQYSVQTYEDWGYVEDVLKEMLTELGVSITIDMESRVKNE